MHANRESVGRPGKKKNPVGDTPTQWQPLQRVSVWVQGILGNGATGQKLEKGKLPRFNTLLVWSKRGAEKSNLWAGGWGRTNSVTTTSADE